MIKEIEKTVIAVCLDLLDIVFVKNDFITFVIFTRVNIKPIKNTDNYCYP